MLATDSVLWSILIDFLPCMDLEFGRPIKFILINLSGTHRKLLRELKVFHERFLVGEIWEKGLVRWQYVVNANLRSSHQTEPWNLYLVDFWLLDCFLWLAHFINSPEWKGFYCIETTSSPSNIRHLFSGPMNASTRDFSPEKLVENGSIRRQYVVNARLR